MEHSICDLLRRCHKLTALLLLLLLSATGFARQAPVKSYVDGGRIPKKKIRTMLRETGVPGISLAVIRHNKVVFAKGYGFKTAGGKERVNRHTVFEAASLSKSFLVYTVHRLIDEGRFNLDTPMYRYLDPGTLLNYDDRYKKITPRMILSHSSGLENWRMEHNPEKLEIVADPGTAYVYSGEGYTWLSAVLEVMLQQSYSNYIRDMVLSPLALKDVYLAYDTLKNEPGNYATGHDQFGHAFPKWKNVYPVPAGGIHLTAREYARLVIGIFNGKNLSAARERDLKSPIIRLNADTTIGHFFGPGFEILYSGGDTIISHGSSNTGFKGLVFYSTVSGNGFVLLTNADRGKWMAKYVSDITAGLNINPIFKGLYYDQYPSHAISLFRLYNEGKKQEMSDSITALASSGRLGANTLNELGDVLMEHDSVTAAKMLTQNTVYFPSSPQAYFLRGRLHARQQLFQQAIDDFRKAGVLGFEREALEQELKRCEQEMIRLTQK